MRLRPALLSVILLFSGARVWGAAITSAGSGNWSASGTWSPAQVPSVSDSVTILAGHTVTVDVMTATASTTTINGKLSFSRVTSSSLTLVGGDITVKSGGTLDMGTAASPMPSGVNAHLILALGAAWQYSNAPPSLTINNGGNFTAYGAAKTPFGYATQSITGARTSFTIAASSAAGWAVGDVVTIGPTFGPTTSDPTITTEERTIASISGTDPLTISWSGGLAADRILTSTTPIIVADLTRNVLVRSSGTATGGASVNAAYIVSLAGNATSFSLINAEIAYMACGWFSYQDGILTQQAIISSSTIRNGCWGLNIGGANTNVTVTHSLIYRNSGYDIIMSGNASKNTFTGNNIYANGQDIWSQSSNSNNIFRGNEIYSNGGGIEIDGANNIVAANDVFSNYWASISIIGSGNTVAANNIYLTNYQGLNFSGGSASGNTVVSNIAYSNGYNGINISNGAANNTFVANVAYGNGNAGLTVSAASNNVFWGGLLGYNSFGASAPDAFPDLYLDPAQAESLVLMNTRINPAMGINTSGFNRAGNYLLSYDQDYGTGTVKVSGDYTISGSTLTLDYVAPLYASSATSPKLMRGTGHGATVCSTNDSNAMSQLITIQYSSSLGLWQVTGSASGPLGVITSFGSCPAGSGGDFPAGSPQFNLAFTQGSSPQDGDTVDFALIGASGDPNIQKKLLFENSAAGFNNGRPRLTVASGAGLSLTGTVANPSLMNLDALNASATYYTLVDSGAFTATNAVINNADESGVQLSGSGGASMSNVTFDLAGNGLAATSAYITARNLSSVGAFYNMTFNNSRPNTVMRNVRVSGVDTGLNWTFVCYTGPLAGSAFSDDPHGRLNWSSSVIPIPSFSSVFVSSLTAAWGPVCATNGFVVQASTASDFSGRLFLSSTTNSSALSLPVTGLSPNTTYFAEVGGLTGGATNYSSVIATVTLPATPSPVNVTGINAIGFTVNWSSNSNSSGTRYEVSLSTDVNFSILASSLSTTALSAAFSSGIIPGVTYSIRVRAFNWSGTPTPYAFGAVLTTNNPIAASSNRIITVWYNTPAALFFAQGAQTYHYKLSANPLDIPGLADPVFDGSALSLNLSAGSNYFHVLGISSGSPVGVAHFGPVGYDNGFPVIPSVSAQASSTDPTPISAGATTIATNPRFTWKAPTSSLSPIIGYSVSLSTDPTVQPSTAIAAIQTYVDEVLTAPGLTYFNVMALNAAGTWGTPISMSFTFTNVPSADRILVKNNHFNPNRGQCMQVEVDAASSGHIKIDLYTLLLQHVAPLADQNVVPGIYQYSWCGKNSSNNLAATGVYQLHIEAPQQKKDYKVILVK